MNIVTKEFIASNVDKKGVLVLSEFAGASTELYKDSFLINPYHTEKNADLLKFVLNLTEKEKRKEWKTSETT